MNNNIIKSKLKVINKIGWFYVILGLLEIFILIFLTQNILTMAVGLITLIPAYIGLKERKINWNYFVGIWAIIQFNPIIGVPLTAFVLSDLFNVGNSSFSTLMLLFIIFFALIALAAFILGIILLVKTNQYIKFKKQEKINDSIN